MSNLIKPIAERAHHPKRYDNVLAFINNYFTDVDINSYMILKNSLIADVNQALLVMGDKWGVMDRSKVVDTTSVLLEDVAEKIKSLNDPYFK